VERSVKKVEARVVGSICDFVLAPGDPHEAIERMASPACRIVSLTITEASYLIDGVTGIFEDQHPHVLYDLANPTGPRTFLGYVTEALDRRRERGLPPFTVMSCDNLPENGKATRNVVTSFAEMRSPALRSWIEQNVAFPNSMVDRITPGTTDSDRRLLSERFGIEDQWPVVSEPYRQWVIEDSFCNGRPAWELAGAQFTTEVPLFEAVKLRLLNGSHFALAYLSALLGFEFVHDAMADDRMRRYLRAYMDEVTPSVPVPSGMDIPQYKATLIHRFSNPALCDQIGRICAQGSSKISRFLLPSLEDLLVSKLPTRFLALALASWLQYMKGRDEQGRPLYIQDAALAETQRLLQSDEPIGPAMLRFILGPKLALDSEFAEQLRNALLRLDREGVVPTIDWCLRGS
jgi:mannitol 2-dehydrogenase